MEDDLGSLKADTSMVVRKKFPEWKGSQYRGERLAKKLKESQALERHREDYGVVSLKNFEEEADE